MNKMIATPLRTTACILSALYMGIVLVWLMHRVLPGKLIVCTVWVGSAVSPIALPCVATALVLHMHTHKDSLRPMLVGMLLLLGLIVSAMGTFFLWQFNHTAWSL